MRNDCPSCDSTIKDLTKERRELKRLLNEANTRIEMMSEPKVAPKAHSEFCECNTCTVMRVNSKLWDQIHEMDAQIAVYRDALEKSEGTFADTQKTFLLLNHRTAAEAMQIPREYIQKALSSSPSELLERVKKLEFAVNKSIKYVEKVQREEFQLTRTFEWNSMLREALK